LKNCPQDHVLQVWQRTAFPLHNIENYRVVQHSRMRGVGIHPWANSGWANNVSGLQAVERKLRDCHNPQMRTDAAKCPAPAIADALAGAV